MDLHRSIRDLLGETGSGRRISSSAYDTAWVARLAELGEPLGQQALDWLRANELEEGGWGAREVRYYHDRVTCTLAAMTALARRGETEDRPRLQRAQAALQVAVERLRADPAGEAVGFEMIVPTLAAEAEALGVFPGDPALRRLGRYRAAKLAALPGRTINRRVTVAFSTEMVGPDGLHLLDLQNLQEANGSIAFSPAATAFFALNVRRQDPGALGYLREFAVDGALPYVVPIDVFECAWPLWNLELAGFLDDEMLALCQPHLDLLSGAWEAGQGIASVAGLGFRDGDATGMTYEVLSRFGRPVDLEGVLHYEEDNHFRCYALEANPSISTNIHILGALRRAGLDTQHPCVQKVLGFLRRMKSLDLFWLDKWHASPYYPTAHAIIACAGCDDKVVDSAVFWMLQTQNADGSWGYYRPTAEETAYCLQALVVWKRHGHSVAGEALQRGAAWLADRAQPPYPPLWIGKCLYCPELVVRSAILSALALAGQE